MTEFFSEFRPVTLTQRILAAAMTIAFVPIAAALLRFVVTVAFGMSGFESFEIWSNPILGVIVGVLSLTSASFLFSWIGFLFLVPLMHNRTPEQFIKSWLRTSLAGLGVGAGIGAIVFLIFGLMVGEGELAILMPIFAAYGALHALVYWVLMRVIYVRRLPPVDAVFA